MTPKKAGSKKPRDTTSAHDTKNAFELLMNKRPKVHHVDNSRFVECPAGCGSHVLEKNMNAHLDMCVNLNEDITTSRISPKVHMIDHNPINHVVTESEQYNLETKEKLASVSQTEDFTQSSVNAVSPASSNSNAFAHMMKQSQRIFSTKETPPLRQRFHLHDDGHLSWTDVNAPPSAAMPDEPTEKDVVRWSAMVVLKGRKMMQEHKDELLDDEIRDIELTVSASVVDQSPMATKRLVRTHSRLSVPVLKSILQKSIRRRRPLPATRVAMELMDKALGEFLRRLPIIMLEDSTLHPDFPLVVWLMTAESKDYVVPGPLLTRLLQIVYEMASCPWTDYTHEVVSSSSPIKGDDSSSSNLCFSSPTFKLQEVDPSIPEFCNVMLRSILLRIQYGGMAGDMKMLHSYMRVWGERYLAKAVTLHVAERLVNASGSAANLKWWNVPELIREHSQKQSHAYVTPLGTNGIDKLVLQDICLAGVDFHCSNVLDRAISDEQTFVTCWEQLPKLETTESSISVRQSGADKRSSVLDTLKRCMWNFSSGVNHRRPLVEIPLQSVDEGETLLKAFWYDTVAKRVENFIKSYVEDRLAH